LAASLLLRSNRRDWINKQMKTHAHRWIVVAAIISVGAGAALSHVIEPGVRDEKIMLTTNTPALRLFPATPGPHPIALLAHGATGSKEMLFRFGEALAAAGFECYSVDQAGHGESPHPCSVTNTPLKNHPSVLCLPSAWLESIILKIQSTCCL